MIRISTEFRGSRKENWYNQPEKVGKKKVRKGFIWLSIGTGADIFQMDKMEDRGVIPGRGGHLKALRNDTA